MYAIVASHFILGHLVNKTETVTDATGATWRTGDIHETAAIIAIFTMLFVCVLADQSRGRLGNAEAPADRRDAAPGHVTPL